MPNIDLSALDPEELAVVNAGLAKKGLVPNELVKHSSGTESGNVRPVQGMVAESQPPVNGTEVSGITVDEDAREVLVPVMSPEETAANTNAGGKPLVAVKIPDNISPKHFRKLLGNAYASYMELGSWTNEDLVSRSGLPAGTVARIATSREFRAALKARGVAYKNTSGLTAEQDMVLQILTNPDGRTLPQKLKQAGITMTKYRAWMKQVGFRRAFENATNGMLSDNNPGLVALFGLAAGGDLNAIKYQHLLNGTYDPNRQDKIDAVALVAQVFNVISRHVRDSDALTAIAAELQLIVQKIEQPVAGQVAPPKTIEMEGL